MYFNVIKNIMRQVMTLSPEDNFSRAVELFRRQPYPILPVVKEGKFIGTVSDSDLLSILPQLESQEVSVEEIRKMSIRKFINTEALTLNENTDLYTALNILEEHHLKVLPVTDAEDNYKGIVTQPDLVSLLYRIFRPARVGGMATPLGVYLHTGHLRAGPGDWGLFLTGMTLTVFWYLTAIILTLLYKYLHLSALIAFFIPLLGYPDFHSVSVFTDSILTMLLFVLLIRLSPLTGYHGAEHQVVNAIEAGEELELEAVKKMSRAHPRCGTNLLVLFVLLYILGLLTAVFRSPYVLAFVLVILVSWRPLGMLLQKLFTTKPASDKQLLNAIQAARELVRQYQENPRYHVDPMTRIWNMGIIQVLLGSSTSFAFFLLIIKIFHLPIIIR